MDVELRNIALRALESLELPADTTLDALISRIQRVRGRRIVVVETPALSGKKICGLWIPREDVDVVYHAETSGTLHRQQMILHELAHMVLRHDEEEDAGWRGVHIFQQISGEVVERALARGDFRTDLELTAEYLADYFAAVIRDGANEIYSYEAYFE